ncbi:hypothetical protein [Kitasatospora acidiphila]|uniref:hypothetical protein n=1 Tax=Kitasatospora acidiphila TaxID=2567942 RepID=UPI003C754F6D
MSDPKCAPAREPEPEPQPGASPTPAPEPDPEASQMTLQVFRVTSSGTLIEVIRKKVWRGESYWKSPIGGEWPPCRCPRCLPMLRSRLRRAGPI